MTLSDLEDIDCNSINEHLLDTDNQRWYNSSRLVFYQPVPGPEYENKYRQIKYVIAVTILLCTCILITIICLKTSR